MSDQITMQYEDGLIDIDTGDLIETNGFVLRGYQNEIVAKTRASIAAGNKRPLIVSPTASGKSAIYAEIIMLAVEKGKTCLFLVHRRLLVKQFAETLKKHCGIEATVIMAGEEFAGQNQVYVSTVHTYHRRMQLGKEDNKFFVPADILLTDEAHTNVSPRWIDIFKEYQDKIIIGTTATPVRSDNRPLGDVFDDIVNVIDVKQLTGLGYLCPVKYYEPAEIDLSKLKIRMGDYEVSGLEKKMNDPKLVGDVVQTWLRLGNDRKTIVFSVNVKHSIALCDEFNRKGVPTCQLDARSPEDEREAVFKKMEDGLIKVICNVYLYVEGVDVPEIGCVVVARPTKSLGAYRQMIGRGLRISPGKKHLIVLDHGGVISEHGYVDDEIDWSLDGKEKAWKKVEPKEKEKKSVKCSVCSLIFEGADKCPDCGSPIKSFGKPVDVIDGDLVESKGKTKMSTAEKRIWFGMFESYRMKKGYKTGWAAHAYRGKTGVWPRGITDVLPIEPNQEFMNWIKYINIKKAKSKNVDKLTPQ